MCCNFQKIVKKGAVYFFAYAEILQTNQKHLQHFYFTATIKYGLTVTVIL